MSRSQQQQQQQRKGLVDTLDGDDGDASPWVQLSDADRHPVTRALSILQVLLGLSAMVVALSASQLLGSTRKRTDVTSMVGNFFAVAGVIVGAHFHLLRMAELEMVLRANAASGMAVARLRTAPLVAAAAYFVAFFAYYGMASDSYAHDGATAFKVLALVASFAGHALAFLFLRRFRNALVIDDVGGDSV